MRMLLSTRAAQIATQAHADAMRACGQPFITHPAWVARHVANQGHQDDVVAIAWLHDVVEDTPLTFADLLALDIPAHVVAAVDALTRREHEDYLDAVRRAASNPLSRIVKIADNTHNTLPEQIACFDPATRSRKIAKYTSARSILAAA